MITEAISHSLHSSFKGLETTIGNLSKGKYAIRNVDVRLQEDQATTAKSSYVNIKLAGEMMQANTEGHLPQKLYDGFSDHCIHTFNSGGGHLSLFYLLTCVVSPNCPQGNMQKSFGMIYLPGRSCKLEQN